MLILTESELRACVGFDAESLRAIEDAFTWLSEGKVEMPPVMHIEVAEHRGDIDIKSVCVRGLDHLAVKVASGFFDNPGLGPPSGGAMVVVLSAKTGFYLNGLADVPHRECTAWMTCSFWTLLVVLMEAACAKSKIKVLFWIFQTIMPHVHQKYTWTRSLS